MKSRIEEAVEKKLSGQYNCAQSVVCTYCDLCGVSEETAADIAGAFGTGMGNMEGTCGSIVGAGIVLGMVSHDRNLARKRMKTIMERFQERNGATRCKLLKGLDKTDDSGRPLPRRECNDCVADAAEFLEGFL